MGPLSSLVLAVWPAADATLARLPLPEGPPAKIRVVIDAGHGAPDNAGNVGCHCQAEQDHTHLVARHLAQVLRASGRFVVQETRPDSSQPRYATRISAAERWRADVIVSIHSDARGWSTPAIQADGSVCYENADDPGFAVLWNDQGPALAGRQRLGRAIGQRLREAGFLPYHGFHYAELYHHDAIEPSGWIDARAVKQRVYFLRASSIPTVIIETHHARDVAEVSRWSEPATLDAFSLAVAAGILDSRR